MDLFFVSTCSMLCDGFVDGVLESQYYLRNISKSKKINLSRFDFGFLDLFSRDFWVDRLICRYSKGVGEVFFLLLLK